MLLSFTFHILKGFGNPNSGFPLIHRCPKAPQGKLWTIGNPREEFLTDKITLNQLNMTPTTNQNKPAKFYGKTSWKCSWFGTEKRSP